MSEHEYTPSTGEIRELVAVGADNPSHGLEDFDRYLAAHDAEVRKQALEEVINVIDVSPAVLWSGKGGVKERIDALLNDNPKEE